MPSKTDAPGLPKDYVFPSPGPSPVASLDGSDPGDETQRNYRYQAAVGGMLIIAAKAGKIDYQAVWCEQREDFLGEIGDGMFDAVQVKTSTPENGAWEVTSAAFSKSVRRFAWLDTDFPGRLRNFHFFSNVDFADSNSVADQHRSIPKLIAAVALAETYDDLAGPMEKAFASLLAKVNHEQDRKTPPEAIFAVLRRLRLSKGPSREDMQDVLCQSHLPDIHDCAHFTPKELSDVAKRLIARVLEASSIQIEAGTRHYAAFVEGKRSPELEAKRLSALDLEVILREQKTDAFRYLNALTSLKIGDQRDQEEDTRRLEMKLKQGGLSEESFVILHRQAVSAESRLLDLATRTQYGSETYAQLENVVRDESNIAALEASAESNSYGKRMLVTLHKRFHSIAREDADRVAGESADMLLGVTGLLTGQCHIWWSEKFEIPAAL